MKKQGIVLLAMAAAALGLAAFAACKDDQTPPPPMEHTHAYSSWIVVDEPTCTKEGLRERTCSCGEKETEQIAVLGHTAGEAVKENEKAPTCTEAGSYDEVVYCTVCEEEVSRKTVEVAPLDHTPGEAVRENEIAATCTEKGSYEEAVYCTVCGDEVSRKTVEVAALNHTPGEAVRENEVAATCTTAGSYEEVVYCTVCEAEVSRKTVTVDALDHTPGEAVKENEVAATCTTAGSYEEAVYCTVCGDEVSRNTLTVDALEHDYKGVVTDEPLCIMDGEKTYTCTRCGDSYTETIDALGHGWAETKPGQAPTCTAAGYTSYKTCLRCGYTTRETIPALQHDWSEQPEWNWADDYTSATATFTCARGCKETETATITSTTTATCTANGDTTYTATATFNGQTYTNEKEVKTEAAGHTWGEWTVTTPAECEKEGEKMRTCSVCGDTEKETIAALDHEWGDWEVTTEATCTTAGEEERTCSRCQETEKQTIAALDHAWSAYSFDETNHWRECTRAGCTTKEQAAHSFTRNTCEICNYAFYSEGLDYKDNGDTVTITGKGDCSDTSIYIPAVISGKRVTEIGNYAFLSCASLKEIVIPEGVISIGSSAFNYCTSLKEVVNTPEGRYGDRHTSFP